jgi:hypothetical protein
MLSCGIRSGFGEELACLGREFVQEGMGQSRGEGWKNGNGGGGRNNPEIGLGVGSTVAAAGRAIKAGLRAENFERLDLAGLGFIASWGMNGRLAENQVTNGAGSTSGRRALGASVRWRISGYGAI